MIYNYYNLGQLGQKRSQTNITIYRPHMGIAAAKSSHNCHVKIESLQTQPDILLSIICFLTYTDSGCQVCLDKLFILH